MDDTSANILYMGKTKMLNINMKIMDNLINVVLDTGGEMNLITKELVDELGLSTERWLGVIAPLGSMKVKANRCTHIPILGPNLEDREIISCVVLEDVKIKFPLLIGWPTLQMLGFKVFDKTQIELNHITYQTMNTDFETPIETTPIYLKKIVKLPPNSQTYVQVKFDKSFFHGNQIKKALIQTIEEHAHYPAAVVNGVMTEDTKRILITNPSMEVLSLPKTREIGRLILPEPHSIYQFNIENDEGN